MTDTERWDTIHQKTHKAGTLYSHYAEEKEKLFPRKSLIVDLGGGTGEDALYFLQKGHSVVLLDISEFALKAAQEKAGQHNLGSKLAVRQVDYGLHAIPIKEGSVDVCYSRIALNYFDSSHTSKLFADIYRILKKGGVAFLTLKSPDDRDEMDYLEKMTTPFEPNVYIENGMLRSRFSVDQLKQMLTKAGIQHFEARPFKEELGVRRESHQQILYLNEVTFSKS